jgi:chromosome segregation ATPase
MTHRSRTCHAAAPVIHSLWTRPARCRRTSLALMTMTTPTETQRKVNRLENDVLAIYEILVEIKEKLTSHDARFDAQDARFDAQDARFDRIEARLDAHDARFDALDAKLDQILDLLRGSGRDDT